MKNLRFALLILLLFLLPLQSHAIIPLSVGPRVGMYKTSGADKSQLMGGVGARLKIFAIGVEGAIDYRSQKILNDQVTMRSYPVTLSALFYPLPIVYAIAGMGTYNTKIDFKDSHIKDMTKKETGYHIGAGVELPLGGMTVAGDIRYIFMNNIPIGGSDFNTDTYTITISVLFNLL